MRTFAKSRIRYSKSQRIGIFAFIALLIALQILIYFIENKPPEYSIYDLPDEVLASREKANETGQELKESRALKDFDPNELSIEGWQELGFSERQAHSILKYKYSLGGNFTTKEQIKNSYVITDKKFVEIEPYIVFGDLNTHKNSDFSNTYSKKTEIKIQYKRFNPNEYSQKDWERIGFSENQAASILKYKRYLGGKFTSLDQIKNCFVISEKKFEEMKPYIVLPSAPKSEGTIRLLEEEEETERAESEKKHLLQKFNPNHLTKEDWFDLGFSERQANTILNYKKSLGGSFPDAKTFENCFAVSAEKFAELEPYMVFD